MSATAFRVDRGSLGQARVDHNGNLIVTGALSRTGVQTYRHSDGRVSRELRHPDDVFDAAAIASLIQLPITDEHPTEGRVTPDNVKRLAVGNLGDTISREDTETHSLVKGDIIIRDAAVIAKAIGEDRMPKRELSVGYQADVVEESGEFWGERYDHRQTNIRGNHVALVRRGRAGPDVRLLLDSEDAVLVEEEWTEDAGGGGSRGGVVIGRTSGGKPIYENHKHSSHNSFTHGEHREAASLHNKLAMSKSGEEREVHLAKEAHHSTLGGVLASKKALNKLRALNKNDWHEDDEHGHGIGRTEGGRTVYREHDDPGHGDFDGEDHRDAARRHGGMAEHHAETGRMEQRTAEMVPPGGERDDAVGRVKYHAARVSAHNVEGLKHWASAQGMRTDSTVVMMRPRADAKDEGSRGGVAIGRTGSGKPIYESHSHPGHKGFSTKDHEEASTAHDKKIKELRGKRRTEKNRAQIREHETQGGRHTNAVQDARKPSRKERL